MFDLILNYILWDVNLNFIIIFVLFISVKKSIERFKEMFKLFWKFVDVRKNEKKKGGGRRRLELNIIYSGYVMLERLLKKVLLLLFFENLCLVIIDLYKIKLWNWK